MFKILIVDDNKIDQKIIEKVLLSSEEKYEVQIADTGEKAVESVEKNETDLILLDIFLPGINGLEAYRRINDIIGNKFLPVIFITEFPKDSIKMEGLRIGAIDYMAKPIHPDELKAKVTGSLRIKKIIDDSNWAAEKTNQGIRILYKELERKNKELMKLDKLKDDFVSTVSHELRTPLGITAHGLSLIADGISGPITEKTKKIITAAQENLDRLTNIINDILDVSLIEEERIELKQGIVNMNKLLEMITEFYYSVVSSKGLVLNTQIPDKDIFVYADEEKIIQVINNLINNAIKFTSKGGCIEIAITVQKSDVKISVKDNGIGIAEEDIDKLFNKFEQFSRMDTPGIKGTGLGLWISKSLVELHGGTIGASSKLKNGSSFYFTLPQYNKKVDDE